MNIFFLHILPSICAIYHNDKHVVKMILETAQLLSSVHYIVPSTYIPQYKLTHKNHPCSKWARESMGNYLWLCDLGMELCKEYTHRYGKVHKCQAIIQELKENLPDIEKKEFTMPAQAMPDTYKEDDSVYAYRHYYFFDKSHIASWTKRDKPDWWVELEEWLDE